MRRTPLNPKRATPRRNEGRISHGRMKPRASEGPTEDQLRFWESLRFYPDGRNRPCQCGCGKVGEAIHHLLARAPGKGKRRDHNFVVILAHACHNGRSDSVHGLGSEAAFERVHGVDLVAVAVENLARWNQADSK
jgi:hypothetical protein